jgi:trans-aconitate methyltransferase
MGKRKRSDKLAGEDYLRFWERRAENSMTYVGRPDMDEKAVMRQAERFWRVLEPHLPGSANISTATEFGCGWGRMTDRLARTYPSAAIWGIEMVLASIEHGQSLFPEINFFQANCYHNEVPDADLLMTCTCLQHITDPAVFCTVVDSFHRKVKPGGTLVLFENAREERRHWHLHDLKISEYIDAFAGFDFEEPTIITDVDPEPHFIMRGIRRTKWAAKAK